MTRYVEVEKALLDVLQIATEDGSWIYMYGTEWSGMPGLTGG